MKCYLCSLWRIINKKLRDPNWQDVNPPANVYPHGSKEMNDALRAYGHGNLATDGVDTVAGDADRAADSDIPTGTRAGRAGVERDAG